MSASSCQSELNARAIAVTDAKASGVRQPCRLAGPLSGIAFEIPAAPSPWGVMDCRLVLALDDMARWLHAYGVRRVVVDNTFRPEAVMSSGEPSQHALGLAIDIKAFVRDDDTALPVLGTWTPMIGQPPCGPTATLANARPDELWLRGMVCAIARRGSFHHMLTPNADAAHRDHLHFDIDATSTQRFLR